MWLIGLGYDQEMPVGLFVWVSIEYVAELVS